LWIVSLEVEGNLRVTGHRLDGPGELRFQFYGQPQTQELLFEDPRKQSVIPGGASREVMQAYAFLPSYVIYPSAGCWEFIAKLGTQETRFALEVKSPRYATTLEPIDVGSSAPLCVAVDPSDATGVWWWEPGRTGCSGRSTGPRLLKADEGHVARRGDVIEAGFRLGLHARPPDRDHLDVHIVIDGGRARSTSGGDVAVIYRGDLEIPWR
jgi:hypothetical protein